MGFIHNSTQDEISQALTQARQAQALWRSYTLTQRVDCMRKLGHHLADQRERLIAIIHEETGKPVAEIESMELIGCELTLKHYTSNAHRILQDHAVRRPWLLFNKRAYVRYAPRGVVGLITSWSLPMLGAWGDAIPALVAGNAVVWKPSEWSTKTALYLQDRVKASGLFPEGLFQVMIGDGQVGAELVRWVDMVLFTGRAQNGRQAAAIAAERLIPAVLELRGKHPMIVAKDAPLERAAKAAVWGGLANCGQLSTSVERVYVEESLYASFSEAVAKEMSKLRQGLEFGYDMDLGRLAIEAQLGTLERHLEDARSQGARVIGGEILDRQRLLVSPALILDATPKMLVMQEETFGPVLALMSVRDLKEAFQLANQGPYGLSGSFWTKNLAQGENLGLLLEAGLIGINDLPGPAWMAGRRHSDEGLRMFCQAQSVVVHEWPMEAPDFWWFPYNRIKCRILAWLTRLI